MQKPNKLLEMKRTEFIERTKSFSKARYDRRLNYTAKVKFFTGADDYRRSGDLSLLIEVGGYKLILELIGLRSFITLAKSTRQPTREFVGKILKEAIDKLDLKMFCTCADFKYRFNYTMGLLHAIPNGIPLETRDSKIRNPGHEGALCKHLSCVLASPSNWISPAITLVRSAIIEDMKSRNPNIKSRYVDQSYKFDGTEKPKKELKKEVKKSAKS